MIGKHPYNPECVCKRCLAEFTRRGLQAQKTEKNRRKTARRRENATRAEQHERLLDCGPQAWDDRD